MVLKVDYQRLNSFFSDYTSNISKGGTRIETESPLPVGTEFVFHLSVPGLTKPLRIHGEVAWNSQEGSEDAPGEDETPSTSSMGIEFTYKTGDSQQQIEARVESLMVASLGRLLYTKLMNNKGQD